MKLSNKYRNAVASKTDFTMHMKLGYNYSKNSLKKFPQRNISYSIVFENCHHLYLISSPSAIFSKEDVMDPVAFW